MNSKLIISSLLTGILLVFVFRALQSSPSGAGTGEVTIENGVQTAELYAKGGYSPSQISFQAGMPAVLKVQTDSTYDCSASLVIPALNYSTFLPASGTTFISIPAQDSGSTIKGSCGMGMYGFKLIFE